MKNLQVFSENIFTRSYSNITTSFQSSYHIECFLENLMQFMPRSSFLPANCRDDTHPLLGFVSVLALMLQEACECVEYARVLVTVLCCFQFTERTRRRHKRRCSWAAPSPWIITTWTFGCRQPTAVTSWLCLTTQSDEHTTTLRLVPNNSVQEKRCDKCEVWCIYTTITIIVLGHNNIICVMCEHTWPGCGHHAKHLQLYCGF